MPLRGHRRTRLYADSRDTYRSRKSCNGVPARVRHRIALIWSRRVHCVGRPRLRAVGNNASSTAHSRSVRSPRPTWNSFGGIDVTRGFRSGGRFAVPARSAALDGLQLGQGQIFICVGQFGAAGPASGTANLAADGRCRPLAFVDTAGQAHDAPQFTSVTAAIRVPRAVGRPRVRPDAVLAGLAYSSRAIRTHMRGAGSARWSLNPTTSGSCNRRGRRGRRGGRSRRLDRNAYRLGYAVERAASSGTSPGVAAGAASRCARTNSPRTTKRRSTSPRSPSGSSHVRIADPSRVREPAGGIIPVADRPQIRCRAGTARHRLLPAL